MFFFLSGPSFPTICYFSLNGSLSHPDFIIHFTDEAFCQLSEGKCGRVKADGLIVGEVGAEAFQKGRQSLALDVALGGLGSGTLPPCSFCEVSTSGHALTPTLSPAPPAPADFPSVGFCELACLVTHLPAWGLPLSCAF